MTDVPKRIEYLAQRLHDGHRAHRMTVRTLLSDFGALRRGNQNVTRIRQALDALGLDTEPDFDSAWIDAPIALRLKSGQPAAAPAAAGGDVGDLEAPELPEVQRAEAQAEAAPRSEQPAEPRPKPSAAEAPTFRIGRLPAANKTLISVGRDDSVAKAVTLMLAHDYSQLPVMQGAREVKGVLTWKAIGRAAALGRPCGTVAECQEPARIVEADWSFFDAIPIIVTAGYVLVRGADKRITGIVTSSDLNLQFRELAEPYLLLREIEMYIRGMLRPHLRAEDYAELNKSSSWPIRTVDDLTLGRELRLLGKPEIWSRIAVKADRSTLAEILECIRKIRNDVMHFDPEPLSEAEIQRLKQAAALLQQLCPQGVQPETAVPLAA